MPAEIIGRCKCPVCSSDKASLRLSGKQLAYILCNTCNIQCFARSDVSDTKLRALLIADATPELEPVASAPAATRVPVVPTAPPLPPPAKKPAPGWGLKW